MCDLMMLFASELGKDIRKMLAGLPEGCSWQCTLTWMVQHFVGAGF